MLGLLKSLILQNANVQLKKKIQKHVTNYKITDLVSLAINKMVLHDAGNNTNNQESND